MTTHIPLPGDHHRSPVMDIVDDGFPRPLFRRPDFARCHPGWNEPATTLQQARFAALLKRPCELLLKRLSQSSAFQTPHDQ